MIGTKLGEGNIIFHDWH